MELMVPCSCHGVVNNSLPKYLSGEFIKIIEELKKHCMTAGMIEQKLPLHSSKAVDTAPSRSSNVDRTQLCVYVVH